MGAATDTSCPSANLVTTLCTVAGAAEPANFDLP